MIVPVPVLTPRLSSHWVGLVTPVPAGRSPGRSPSRCATRWSAAEHDIARYVPDPPGGPIGFDQALSLALQRVQEARVDTRWSSASLPGAPSDPLPTDPGLGGRQPLHRRAGAGRAGGPGGPVAGDRGHRRRERLVLLPARLGGARLARPARRRGRAAPRAAGTRTGCGSGDSLDFWRVEEIEPGELLRLRAEMRLPGLAWLEMSVATDDQGRTLYRQRALFHPHGLLGHAYWWGVSPFHAVVFGGMARNIAAAAQVAARARQQDREPVADSGTDN